MLLEEIARENLYRSRDVSNLETINARRFKSRAMLNHRQLLLMYVIYRYI